MTITQTQPAPVSTRKWGVESLLKKAQDKVAPRTPTKWLNPELSVGQFITKAGREHIWEAIGDAYNIFKLLAPGIKTCIENSVEPIACWVSWSIYMIGKTATSSSPTILFCSEVLEHRKEVRNTIKASGLLDPYPGIKTGHMCRAPNFRELVPLHGPTRIIQQTGNVVDVTPPLISATPSARACGMQLLITDSIDHGLEARKTTVGGVIFLGEKYYYTTAAHAFLSELAKPKHTATVGLEVDSDTDTGIDSLSLDGDSDEDNLAVPSPDVGVEGVIPLDYVNVCQAVPAMVTMQSVDTLQHETQNRQVGDLYLTSLDNGATGLDYALVEVIEDSHKVENTYRSDPSSNSGIAVTSILDYGDQESDVLAITSSGTIPGISSAAPHYVRSPSDQAFCEMLGVKLNKELTQGDCGSWVIGMLSGKLHGQIVAGSPKDGMVLLVPFRDIFKDITQRIGLSPMLPVKSKQHITKYTGQETDQFDTWCDADVEASRNLSRSGSKGLHYVESSSTALISTLQAAMLPRADVSSHISGATIGMESLDNQPQSAESSKADGIPPQPYTDQLPSSILGVSTDSKRFHDLLFMLSQTPTKWENPGLLREALMVIPLDRICGAAYEEVALQEAELASLEGDQNFKWAYKDCLVRALLCWFKRSFFTWVNSPPCPVCLSVTAVEGKTSPTDKEKDKGALVVEIFKCATCGAYERFPRYSEVRQLLHTRRGRAGEWANCFGFLCRALGIRTRWVWNAEDHVWTEVWSDHSKRWIHVDSTEEAWDKPRLYTEGWGKRMSYCIAFSTDGATDVTRRYVRQAKFALPRNRCSEEALLHIITDIKSHHRANTAAQERVKFEMEDIAEDKELQQGILMQNVSDVLSKLDTGPSTSSSSSSLSASKTREATQSGLGLKNDQHTDSAKRSTYWSSDIPRWEHS